MARPTKEDAAAKTEERKPRYTKADFASSEKLAKELKIRREGKVSNSSPRRVPLKPERLAKLQEEDRNLHSLLQHDSVKQVTRELHKQHGVSSPAMRAQSSRPSSGPPPIYEGYNSRTPTHLKGKVFFGGKPGKQLPMTKAPSMAATKTEKTATPAAIKVNAPALKTIDQVAASKERKTTRATAKPRTSGMGSTVAKATARARAKSSAPAGLEHSESTVQPSRNGPKAPMTDHMQPQQFGGLAKAASHGRIGKQSVSSTGYAGKHRGVYNATEDARRVALSGSISYGKHSAEGSAMYSKKSYAPKHAAPVSQTPAPSSQMSIGDKVRARMSGYSKV